MLDNGIYYIGDKMVGAFTVILAGTFTLWNTIRLSRDAIIYLKEEGSDTAKHYHKKEDTGGFCCCPSYYYEENED